MLMKLIEAFRTVCEKCGWKHSRCKSCRIMELMEDLDTEEYANRILELIRTMTIRPLNNWFTGTIGGYPFQVKVTEEESPFGIMDGRIIKLFITEKPNGEKHGKEELISYERGWNKKPASKEADELVDALYEFFSQRMDEDSF